MTDGCQAVSTLNIFIDFKTHINSIHHFNCSSFHKCSISQFQLYFLLFLFFFQVGQCCFEYSEHIFIHFCFIWNLVYYLREVYMSIVIIKDLFCFCFKVVRYQNCIEILINLLFSRFLLYYLSYVLCIFNIIKFTNTKFKCFLVRFLFIL